MTLPATTSTNREYSLRCSAAQNGGDFVGLASDAITIVPTEGGDEKVRIEFPVMKEIISWSFHDVKYSGRILRLDIKIGGRVAKAGGRNSKAYFTFPPFHPPA